MQSAENVEPPSSGERPHEQTGKRPQNSEKGTQNEMSGIDNKIARLPCLASSSNGSNFVW